MQRKQTNESNPSEDKPSPNNNNDNNDDHPERMPGSTSCLARESVQSRLKAKQISTSLVKIQHPKSILIVSKTMDKNIAAFTKQLAQFFIDSPRSASPCSLGLLVYLDAKLAKLDEFHDLCSSSSHHLRWWTPEFCAENSDQIDIVITLGGDGTVLYAAWLFQYTTCPPIVSFHLGSMGFLTNFPVSALKPTLLRLIGCSGDGVSINMRMRLKCTITTRNGVEKNKDGSMNDDNIKVQELHILNDLVVDRGPSAMMSQLELIVDGRNLTTVQADGLVISTPTGSTAYSLSAGGALTHPGVNSILVTPICPHTLSFRPMLLPDAVELRIQVPSDSRTSAWASFDGRNRIEMRRGDYADIVLSAFPVPTVCAGNQGEDWQAHGLMISCIGLRV